MTGHELLRRLRRLARREGLALLYEGRSGRAAMAGSGSVERFSTIPALTHEIAPGPLTMILRDLGLQRRDLS